MPSRPDTNRSYTDRPNPLESVHKFCYGDLSKCLTKNYGKNDKPCMDNYFKCRSIKGCNK